MNFSSRAICEKVLGKLARNLVGQLIILSPFTVSD